METLKGDDQIMNNDIVPASPPTIILSLVFALSVGLGVLIWFDQLSRLIIKYRDKINVLILNKLIKSLGAILFVIFIG